MPNLPTFDMNSFQGQITNIVIGTTLGGRADIRVLIERGQPHYNTVSLYCSLGYRAPASGDKFEQCFILPMNTSLTDEEVEYIGNVIRNLYE